MKPEIDDYGYLRYEITQDWLDTAKTVSLQVPDLRNSIRGIAARFIGVLGELAFAQYTGLEPFQSATYHYDFVDDGITYDVKTKDRNVPCQPDYEASAYADNIKQNYDYYVGCSVQRGHGMFKYVQIIGVIPKATYWENRILVPAGTMDLTNGWEASIDCYNCYYRHFTTFG
jgi:hypothetical protein